MEYDSSESMRSVERADVPWPSTDGVRLTAARRRWLQRRRAAEAQRASAAAIAAAATAVTEVSDREETTRRVEGRTAVCRSVRAMDMWPEFDQLVVGPSEVQSAAVQTEAVCILPAPPMKYDAETQAEVSVTDAAVGANL